MAPEELMDLPSLASFVDYTTMARLQEGSVGLAFVVAYANPGHRVGHRMSKHVNKSVSALSYTVASQVDAPIDFRNCSGLDAYSIPGPLRSQYLAVAMYEAVSDVTSSLRTDACSARMRDLLKVLARPQRIVQGAAELASLLPAPLTVVHVRPHPDKCLALWTGPDPGMYAPGVCHVDLRKPVARAVREAATSAVYLLAPPEIHPAVSALLAGANKTILTYANVSSTSPQLSAMDDTAAFLVEQEMAMAASAFIGSCWSSNSRSINEIREVRGLRVDACF